MARTSVLETQAFGSAAAALLARFLWVTGVQTVVTHSETELVHEVKVVVKHFSHAFGCACSVKAIVKELEATRPCALLLEREVRWWRIEKKTVKCCCAKTRPNTHSTRTRGRVCSLCVVTCGAETQLQ